MAITTQSEIAGPVNRVFQTQLLRQAKARCPYFVGSLPGDIASHAGSFTVLWRRIDTLTPTTSALSELTGTLSMPTRAATQAGITNVTATVSKYGDHIFLTEEVDLVNPNGLVAGLMDTLGIQAGQSLNRLQRNVLEDNATLVYASGASADANVADKISANLIRNAVNTLNRNSAMLFTAETQGSQNIGTSPVRPAYWGICHSDVEEDVRDLNGFIAVERYSGQTATAAGEFGTIGGVRWISSPEGSIDTDSGGDPGATLRSTSGAAADLYTSMIFGMDYHGAISLDTELIQEVYTAGDMIPGIILISKAKGSAGTGDPLDEVASLGWKSWHAGAIMNANFGRGLRTGASVLD